MGSRSPEAPHVSQWLAGTISRIQSKDFLFPVKSLGGGWTNPFEKYARQIGSFLQN